MISSIFRLAHCALSKMPIQTDIVGKWNFATAENFDEYLKEIGIGWATRTIATKVKPTLDIVVDGEEWKITSTSTFKTHVTAFKLGAPVDQKTIDGRDVSSVFTIENDKLVQVENGKDGGKSSRIERFIDGGKLVIVCESNNVKSTRTYTKA